MSWDRQFLRGLFVYIHFFRQREPPRSMVHRFFTIRYDRAVLAFFWGWYRSISRTSLCLCSTWDNLPFVEITIYVRKIVFSFLRRWRPRKLDLQSDIVGRVEVHYISQTINFIEVLTNRIGRYAVDHAKDALEKLIIDRGQPINCRSPKQQLIISMVTTHMVKDDNKISSYWRS